ncbi:MAG: hypothetical protein ChlgKO_12430 [Chlamydiales bacterium]
MALYLIVMSALFASLQNLFMRRSVDTKGSTNFYILSQLLVSCIIAIILNPIRSGNYAFDMNVALMGIGFGLVLGLMMWGLGETLKVGSSALSFATINSCSILPAVTMALLFGASFGHPYRWFNGVGSLLVIGGIFWSSWRDINCTNKKRWIFFIVLTSLSYVFFSAGMQWKVLLETHGNTSAFLPFSLDATKSSWLMPFIFLTAALFQFVVSRREGIRFSKDTLVYGTLGGISNGSSMFLMLAAVGKAFPWQNAIIFPLFSIAVIEICNLFGKYIYKEEIQWVPQYLCIGGLILGSVQWPTVFGG